MTLSNNLIYADYNANVPLRKCARDAMLECMEIAGNPSSIHKNGQNLRRIIENSRANISAALGNISGQLVFTSGATEAAQLAIESAAILEWGGVFIGAVEHDCVYKYASSRFPNARFIPLKSDGEYDIDWLEYAVSNIEKPLVLMMAVNNETGIIQNIKSASNIVRSKRGMILVDAVQALGKIEISEIVPYCDYLFVSGHKIGAPIGVGALVYAAGIDPYLGREGGGQEKGMRSGTQNAPAIAAFSSAITQTDFYAENEEISAIRDEFENQLITAFPNAMIIGQSAPRIANTSCFAIPNINAQALLIFLDLEGIAVSSGSACSSGSAKTSRAISALNLDKNFSENFIRVSFGYKNTIDEVRTILSAIQKAYNLQTRRAA